jgi:hypothetical protein
MFEVYVNDERYSDKRLDRTPAIGAGGRSAAHCRPHPQYPSQNQQIDVGIRHTVVFLPTLTAIMCTEWARKRVHVVFAHRISRIFFDVFLFFSCWIHLALKTIISITIY